MFGFGKLMDKLDNFLNDYEPLFVDKTTTIINQKPVIKSKGESKITIDGASYSGNTISYDGENIFVDGKPVWKTADNIDEIDIEGDITTCKFPNVTITGTVDSVVATNVTIYGEVTGSIVCNNVNFQDKDD